MIRFLPSVGIACLLQCASAFSPQGRSHHHTSLWSSSSSSSHASHPPSRLQLASRTNADPHRHPPPSRDRIASALLSLSVGLLAASAPMVVVAAAADDSGASIAANSKITTGGASTLQSGRTIAITRGVNLDRSDFKGANLRGVAFQQSIVRDSDFSGANLVGASFFDATVDGSNFEGADMSLCNVEMAQFNRANLKNAVLREMYVSGSTLFEGVRDIEGSDWSDTQLRKDQTKYLCNHPTAKGTNPVTGVDTRESLMCLD